MPSPIPTHDEIRATRNRLGLSPAEAAARALVAYRTWVKYETGEREIPAPTWALFRLRSGVITLSDLDREAAQRSA